MSPDRRHLCARGLGNRTRLLPYLLVAVAPNDPYSLLLDPRIVKYLTIVLKRFLCQ